MADTPDQSDVDGKMASALAIRATSLADVRARAAILDATLAHEDASDWARDMLAAITADLDHLAAM
jgi:hypothetical protein